MPHLWLPARLRSRVRPVPPPQVVGVTITTTAPSPFYVNGVYDIDFSVALSDGSSSANPTLGVQFTSSNPSVATVDPITGRVTAVNAGSVTINYRIGGITGSIPLTVTSPTQNVTSLLVSPASLSITSLAPSNQVALAPKDASNVTVAGQTVTASGHNTSVCTVSIAGYIATITYVGAGSTTITFTCNGITATVAVTATAAPTGNWPDLVTGIDKIFLAPVGDTTSSAQRVDLALLCATRFTQHYNYAKANYGQWWSTVGVVNGGVLNPGGGLAYYEAAVARLAYAAALGEAVGGTYYNQAIDIAQNYRDFLATTGTTPGAHWWMPNTLLMLWLLNGDTVARNQINRLARVILGSVTIPPNVVKDSGGAEGREIARRVMMCLAAHKAGLGTAQGPIQHGATTYSSWLALAVAFCDRYVLTQITVADNRNDGLGHDLAGSFNWGHNTANPSISNNDGQTNYQMAMMMDAAYRTHLLSPHQSYLDMMTAAYNYWKTTQFGNTGAGLTEGHFYNNRKSDGTGLGTTYRDNTGTTGFAADLGLFLAPLAYRLGDVTFARRLLGINAANQFGSVQSRCGALGVWNNPANSAYLTPPSNPATQFGTQMKQVAEATQPEAWEVAA